MDEHLFTELIARVGPRIQKKHTFMREPLDIGLKIALTLRYLASGDSYKSMAYNFRVPHNTISVTIPEVCQAIYNEYHEEAIKCPTTPEEWLDVEESFYNKAKVPSLMSWAVLMGNT